MSYQPSALILWRYSMVQARLGHWLAALALLLLALAPRPFVHGPPPSVTNPGQLAATLARAPLMFVPNMGQFASATRYALQGGAATLALAEDGLWISIHDQQAPAAPAQEDGPPMRTLALKLSFVGANRSPRIEPFAPLATHFSYFTGNDPRAWQSNVPAWGGVRYRELYPGVDLELSGAEGRLSSRVVLRPGGDASAVRLHVDGAERLALAGNDLRLDTALGPVLFALPQLAATSGAQLFSQLPPSLQGSDVARPFAGLSPPAAPIASQSAINLSYSILIGGSDEDKASNIVVDSKGAVYVTGYTTSRNFPTSAGALNQNATGYNVFVVKLKPNSTDIEYAAVVGGNSSIEYSNGLAVNASGEAYVVGYTASNDFPTTPGAYNSPASGVVDKDHRDAYVFKLNASGSSLVYSTHIGGSGDERTRGLALDTSGAVYITGLTPSSNFPTTVGAYDRSYNGGSDAYVLKLNPSGSGLDYSTLLGGAGDEKGTGIVVDSSGNAYVTGWTGSLDFPTRNAYDPSPNGDIDAFVAKINPTGTDLIYSTYLGGSLLDRGMAIAIDTSGAAYIVGLSTSTNLPATGGAFDTSANGDQDAFAAKLSPSGTALSYLTYLGGSSFDESAGIALNGNNELYASGFTTSSNFPVSADAAYSGPTGAEDAFVVKLNASGSGLLYGTYLGSSTIDSAEGLALDRSGALYITGQGGSNFPVTTGSFHGGPMDVFIAKLQVDQVVVPTYQLSGSVVDGDGKPVSGVPITLTPGNLSAVTNESGGYHFSDLAADTYTVAPNQPGIQFSPSSHIVQVNKDVDGQDFTLLTVRYKVTGLVIDNSSGAGVAGVAISAGASGTATTDKDGKYELLLANGSYTLTPSQSSYAFTPASRAVVVSSADVGGGNFVGTRSTPPPPPTTRTFLPFAKNPPPVIPCDSYEPNDDRKLDDLPTIALGMSIQAKICSGDEDNYLFSLPQSAKPHVIVDVPLKLRGKMVLVIYSKSDTGTSLCLYGETEAPPKIDFKDCQTLPAGRYILRIYTDDAVRDFDTQNPYRLLVTTGP